MKGFPEAITAAFPQTIVQTCIVHLIRHSLEFVSWKIEDRSSGRCGATRRWRRSRPEWGQKYPAIARELTTQFVIPFFQFPKDMCATSSALCRLYDTPSAPRSGVLSL
nr:transposase [Rhizobium leguminosarum]